MNDKDREAFEGIYTYADLKNSLSIFGYKPDEKIKENYFSLWQAALGYARKEQREPLEMAAGALKQIDDILENQDLPESDKGWRIATVIAPIRLTLQQHGYGKD